MLEGQEVALTTKSLYVVCLIINTGYMQVSVPAWFTMDTRLGSISVHLDTPQCFSAEMYAVDLNVAGASEELKVLGFTSCSLANSDSSHYL